MTDKERNLKRKALQDIYHKSIKEAVHKDNSFDELLDIFEDYLDEAIDLDIEWFKSKE